MSLPLRRAVLQQSLPGARRVPSPFGDEALSQSPLSNILQATHLSYKMCPQPHRLIWRQNHASRLWVYQASDKVTWME